jgi:histidinol dehydrogenase
MSTIGSVKNHRGREEGALIYPVYSRRSGGLSVGINLFPDRKVCLFDCPYCEVFPFQGAGYFSVERMEAELVRTLEDAGRQGIAVKDICFSGNGEPSLSPFFPEALKKAARIRSAAAAEAALVLITNGTGLLRAEIFGLLCEAAAPPESLDIWLKLDAGTPRWYEKINRPAAAFAELIVKIRDFVRLAPVTVQTMLCAVDGMGPPPEEEAAWEQLARELARTGMEGPGIRGFQLYGKVRPAPMDPKCQALTLEYLEKRAASLRAALAAEWPAPPAGGGLNRGPPPVAVFS